MVNDNFLLNFLGKILVQDWEDEFEYCLGISGNCICIGSLGFILQTCKNTLGFRKMFTDCGLHCKFICTANRLPLLTTHPFLNCIKKNALAEMSDSILLYYASVYNYYRFINITIFS